MSHSHNGSNHSDSEEVEELSSRFITYRDTPTEENFMRVHDLGTALAERIIRAQERRTHHTSTLDDDDYHTAISNLLLACRTNADIPRENFGPYFLTSARNAVVSATRHQNAHGGEMPTVTDIEGKHEARGFSDIVRPQAGRDDEPRDTLGSTQLDRHIHSRLLRFTRPELDHFITLTESRLSGTPDTQAIQDDSSLITARKQYARVWATLKTLPDLVAEIDGAPVDEELATVRRILTIARVARKQKTPASPDNASPLSP